MIEIGSRMTQFLDALFTFTFDTTVGGCSIAQRRIIKYQVLLLSVEIGEAEAYGIKQHAALLYHFDIKFRGDDALHLELVSSSVQCPRTCVTH